MPKYTTRLVNRTEVAEGTMAFAFERPPGFDFIAGQFMTLNLTNPLYTDAKGNRRIFSIVSPPQEKEIVQIATRMTGSAFKRTLAEMAPGAPIELFGPGGSFTLHRDPSVRAVFVAGGIGITPFRCMLRDAVERGLPHPITLIYSNRTPEGAAFHAELSDIARARAGCTYVPTMSQAELSQQPWNGERRYVDAAFLRDHVQDMTAPIFYLAGPPGLVAGIVKVLADAGADPAHVRAEEFKGY